MESFLLSSAIRTLKVEDVSIKNLETDKYYEDQPRCSSVSKISTLWVACRDESSKRTRQPTPLPSPGEYIYELYPRFQCLFAPAVLPHKFSVDTTHLSHPNLYPLDESENDVSFQIRARDTVDVLLSGPMMPPHQPACTSYLVRAFDPIPMLNAQSLPAAHRWH